MTSKFHIDIAVEEARWDDVLPDAGDVIKNLCARAVESTGFTSHVLEIEISIVLANDAVVKELNRDYRGKDAPTNVLSFPSEELEAGNYEGLDPYVVLGDVILALEKIEAEAAEQDKTIREHFCHLVVHGILHLLGYDHMKKDEAEKMESLEIEILKKFGIDNPY